MTGAMTLPPLELEDEELEEEELELLDELELLLELDEEELDDELEDELLLLDVLTWMEEVFALTLLAAS